MIYTSIKIKLVIRDTCLMRKIRESLRTVSERSDQSIETNTMN